MNVNIPFAGIGVLAGGALLVFITAYGYANVVDWFAYRLHHHAKTMRVMHAKRNAELEAQWAGRSEHELKVMTGRHDV